MKQKSDWENIKKYLLGPECATVHKTIWIDFAMVTDRSGKRYRIEASQTLGSAKNIVDMARPFHVERPINGLHRRGTPFSLLDNTKRNS